MKKVTVFLALYAIPLFCYPVQAVTVHFQNGTATFSQGGFSVDQAVDGIFDNSGWAIDPYEGMNQTAVWETTEDVSGNRLTFTMYFNHSNPGHLLGHFRLSTTKDNRSTFADGLDSGGNVNANWTVLTNPIITGPIGMIFKTLSDNSILVGGTVPATGTYTVIYNTPVVGVTGIRLETLTDPSLPSNGPGFFSNGNFVLSEMMLDASNVSSQYIDVTTIPDVNGDGVMDQAVLAMSSGNYYLRAIDSATGQQVKQVTLGIRTDITPSALTAVGNQISLLITKSNGVSVLQLRDNVTLAIVKTLTLPK